MRDKPLTLSERRDLMARFQREACMTHTGGCVSCPHLSPACEKTYAELTQADVRRIKAALAWRC